MGLITNVDQHIRREIHAREYVFYRVGILEIDPTGKRTCENLNMVLLYMNSLYPSAVAQYSLSCGNYKWLDNPCDSSFSNISTIEEYGPQ